MLEVQDIGMFEMQDIGRNIDTLNLIDACSMVIILFLLLIIFDVTETVKHESCT